MKGKTFIKLLFSVLYILGGSVAVIFFLFIDVGLFHSLFTGHLSLYALNYIKDVACMVAMVSCLIIPVLLIVGAIKYPKEMKGTK